MCDSEVALSVRCCAVAGSMASRLGCRIPPSVI